MQLTYRRRAPAPEAREEHRPQPVKARGTSAAPTIVGRDGVERPVDAPPPPPPDWKPEAEARLVQLEEQHRAAQERTLELRGVLAGLGDRIDKGRALIGSPGWCAKWQAGLDAFEIEYALRTGELVEAEEARDKLADEYVASLAGYERLCDQEADGA